MIKSARGALRISTSEARQQELLVFLYLKERVMLSFRRTTAAQQEITVLALSVHLYLSHTAPGGGQGTAAIVEL